MRKLLIFMGFLLLTFFCFNISAKATSDGTENLPLEEEKTEEVIEDTVTEEKTIEEKFEAIFNELEKLTTQDENWFENAIIDKLISLLMGLFGTICVVLVYLKKNKLVTGDLIGAITNNKTTSDDLSKEVTKALNALKESAEQLGVSKELINNVESVINDFKEDVNKKVESLASQVSQLNKDNATIIEILKIAFANNELLVKNGFANEIIKVVDKYDTNKGEN